MSNLRLSGATSGYTELSAPAVAGSNKLTLPTSNGSNRQAIVGDGAGGLSFAWNAGSFFYRLNSGVAGANVTTAQSVFGVGVTLAASTVYAFEIVYLLNKTAGATTHNVQALFGGTVTLNNILYTGVGTATQGSLPASGSSGTDNVRTPMSDSATTAISVSPNMATANVSITVQLRGTVSVNASGTFIPQYQLSAAPGGAYTTVAGSYVRLTPIGASGSNSSQGTWA